MTGEHFTNFFLQNLPQIAIGWGSGHQGPLEKWLKIPKTIIPGNPGWAEHVLDALVADGFYPALSHKMKLDHGFMTVYHELDPEMELPVVPIVLNCTTPPLMTLRQSYEFGKSVGAAIAPTRAWKGWDWLAPEGCRISSASRGSAMSRRISTAGSSRNWKGSRCPTTCWTCPTTNSWKPATAPVRSAPGSPSAAPWRAHRDHPVLRTHRRMDQRNGCDQLPDLTRPVSSAQSPAVVARARAKCATEENCVPFRRQFRFLDSPTRLSNSTLQLDSPTRLSNSTLQLDTSTRSRRWLVRTGTLAAWLR